MTWLVSWLLGSKVGRWAALALLCLGLAGVAVWWLVSLGAQRERARAAARSLNHLRTRIRIDDEISRMSPAERRRKLARDWGVPDGR